MENVRVPIEECNVSVRTSNVIRSMGLQYLDEIADYTAHELLKFRHFGRFTLREVRKLLAAYGMALRGDLLANSEDDKILIHEMPKILLELKYSLKEIEKRVSCIADQLDQLHCNMQPLEK